MKRYRITYFLLPDAENIVIEILARSEEEAILFAKGYRKNAFNVEEV